MGKDKTMYLTFASSLTDLCSMNSSFDKGVLQIAYTGRNRKKSSFTKEVFERCAPTMYNCPVVCHYDRESDSLGGHDIEIVRDKNDSLKIVNVTTPVGVVPESANYWFETKEDENGVEHEYLFTEVLLWKRQEAYAKIKEDGITEQSMEIKIKDANIVDGYMEVNDFEFNAFCLIGVEPVYEGASLTFSQEDFKNELSKMMQDLKDSYNQVNTSDDVDNKHPQKYSMEGGNQVLDEKMELVAKYGIDVDSLDFSIEDFTLEELTEKFEAMKNAETNESQEGQEQNEPEKQPDESSKQTDGQEETFSLNEEEMKELRNAIESVKVQRPWGEERRYCFMDFDHEASEVYAFDCENRYALYGFKYSKNGDRFEIDFESGKRKKMAVVDFDEGDVEQSFSLNEVFSKMESTIQGNAEMEEKFNTASETITSLESELASLKEFKASIEAAEAEEKRNAVFAMFSDLDGIEAFENLKENCGDMTEDSLKKECFAIRGEFGMQLKFSVDDAPKSNKQKVVKTKPVDAPYGGIVEEYLGSE